MSSSMTIDTTLPIRRSSNLSAICGKPVHFGDLLIHFPAAVWDAGLNFFEEIKKERHYKSAPQGSLSFSP